MLNHISINVPIINIIECAD